MQRQEELDRLRADIEARHNDLPNGHEVEEDEEVHWMDDPIWEERTEKLEGVIENFDAAVEKIWAPFAAPFELAFFSIVIAVIVQQVGIHYMWW